MWKVECEAVYPVKMRFQRAVLVKNWVAVPVVQ
jgi:hypothetical protein